MLCKRLTRKHAQHDYPARVVKVLLGGAFPYTTGSHGAGFSDDKIEIEKRYVDIKIKDIDRWSNVMWTLIGPPVGGWQEGDEEKWDTATAFGALPTKQGFSYYYRGRVSHQELG